MTSFKRVTAIVNTHTVVRVEKRLRELNVPGMTVSEIKGYGAHKNFFHRDLMDVFARLQIYLPEDRVDEIVQAVLETASTGLEDDGIIAITPVEKMYRIYDKSEINPEQT